MDQCASASFPRRRDAAPSFPLPKIACWGALFPMFAAQVDEHSSDWNSRRAHEFSAVATSLLPKEATWQNHHHRFPIGWTFPESHVVALGRGRGEGTVCQTVRSVISHEMRTTRSVQRLIRRTIAGFAVSELSKLPSLKCWNVWFPLQIQL